MACILLSVMNALTVQTKNSSQCQFALFFSDKICESLVGYYKLKHGVTGEAVCETRECYF